MRLNPRSIFIIVYSYIIIFNFFLASIAILFNVSFIFSPSFAYCLIVSLFSMRKSSTFIAPVLSSNIQLTSASGVHTEFMLLTIGDASTSKGEEVVGSWAQFEPLFRIDKNNKAFKLRQILYISMRIEVRR